MSTSHNVFCSRMLYFRGHLGQEGLSGKPLLEKICVPFNILSVFAFNLTENQFLLSCSSVFVNLVAHSFLKPGDYFFPLAHSVPLT